MKSLEFILDKNKEYMIIPDGIIVFNREGKVIAFNEAAARIIGFAEEDVIGEDYKNFFGSSGKTDYIMEVINQGSTFSNLPLDIFTSDHTAINVLSSLTPITRADKMIVSVVFVFRNTQEMISLAETLETTTKQLLDEKNKLDAIFNSNIEGTFTIDKEWNISSFNKSAENITGYLRHEAVGQKCWDIFKSSLCRNHCHMEQTISENKPTIGNELIIQNKNGESIPIKVNSAPLLNSDKKQIGAVETFIDLSEIKNLKEQLIEKYQFENIIGKSKSMLKVYDLLENVAQTDSSVLITGESGTGKELAARAIHLKSSRRDGPFIALNCSAFSENLIESELFGHEKGSFTGAIKTKIGRFELAKGGTLFLDEVADISLPIQVKLLRILETREFERVGGNESINMNARIIAATNKNIQKEISEGRFREDLFFRLNVINAALPSLRERMDDFPLLINHFLDKFNRKFNKRISGLSVPAYNQLYKYKWPGNIRELENILEHCFVLCKDDLIQLEHVPERLVKEAEKSEIEIEHSSHIIRNAEKAAILNTLKQYNGNRIEAAKALGIDKSTLWRKMKKLKIN